MTRSGFGVVILILLQETFFAIVRPCERLSPCVAFSAQVRRVDFKNFGDCDVSPKRPSFGRWVDDPQQCPN